MSATLFVGACTVAQTPIDRSQFYAHMPRSIAVLTPLNNSTNVESPYSYLSTITLPLAERGYYVIPVAVLDNVMKENGLPTGGEMHSAPLDKIGEIVGADAVLYVEINAYGQSYQILSSNTIVNADARLVDTRTGTTLWSGRSYAKQSSGDGGGNGLAGMLVNALVTQVVSAAADPAHALAHGANHLMVYSEATGLPIGPHHPDYVEVGQ